MLVLERVTKTFRKGKRRIIALAPFDLTVKEGQFVAVLGPSGCGKTTCLLIAGGLLRPDSGRVLVGGRDLPAMTPDQLADFRSQTIGFVFQQYHLIPYLSVLENILAPEVARRGTDGLARGRELVAQFGLEHRLDHTPAELSSGEKQRVALARALLFRPKLVLADEITGNLDKENAQIVLGHLRGYAKAGGSVVLVTHDDEIARQADCVERMPNHRKREVPR